MKYLMLACHPWSKIGEQHLSRSRQTPLTAFNALVLSSASNSIPESLYRPGTRCFTSTFTASCINSTSTFGWSRPGKYWKRTASGTGSKRLRCPEPANDEPCTQIGGFGIDYVLY